MRKPLSHGAGRPASQPRGERARKRPLLRLGPVAWARKNLFASWTDGLLTVVGIYLVVRLAMAALDWGLWSATWQGEDGRACAAGGACWPFVAAKLGTFMAGRYPDPERWRIWLTSALALAGLVPLMLPGVPGKLWLTLYMLLVFPVVAFVLLAGGAFGLAPVATELWGGLLVTLVVASVGIAASFPLGILLALARRSELPIVRWSAIGFIEIVRGVPLVTVLFFASVMLPLFLPEGVTVDKLARALVGVALFSAAYLAEVIRGGLQAVPKGEIEAAEALGLSYWQRMGLVVLPRAIRTVIPGIVNSFIALFKDTSLVLVIGLFDLLGIVQQAINSDSRWFSPATAITGYVFAGAVFWVFCFGISRYSAWLERQLGGGRS